VNIEPGKTAPRFGTFLPNPKAKLRDQFHEVCRFKYFSPRTEDSYWQWVVRFLRFHRTAGNGTQPGGLRPVDSPAPADSALRASASGGFLSPIPNGLKSPQSGEGRPPGRGGEGSLQTATAAVAARRALPAKSLVG
jgi:hypothetical protein